MKKIIMPNANLPSKSSLIIETRHAKKIRLISKIWRNRNRKSRSFLIKLRRIKLIKRKSKS